MSPVSKKPQNKYASRAGEKLEFALNEFGLDIKNSTCLDLGSSTGGFVDCLLSFGAKKIYSVDVSYGELAWKLRNDQRVVVMERTNAMHVSLPEKVELVTIDCGWTKQKLVLPTAINNLKKEGSIVSLIKPHYEAASFMVKKGKLEEKYVDQVLEEVKNEIEKLGLQVVSLIKSPIEGARAKNEEFLALIKLAH